MYKSKPNTTQLLCTHSTGNTIHIHHNLIYFFYLYFPLHSIHSRYLNKMNIKMHSLWCRCRLGQTRQRSWVIVVADRLCYVMSCDMKRRSSDISFLYFKYYEKIWLLSSSSYCAPLFDCLFSRFHT